MNNMLESALHYAEMGFAVFPLKPHDKVPLTHHGCNDATRDIRQIKSWWRHCPDANIGLATGSISNNICVVDIDVDEEKGIDGSDTLREWERNNSPLPPTAIAITGRGGYHYYYRITENIKNRANILEGIDFRGTGGYVVAPPSIHSNGNQYEWEYDPDEFPIADANRDVLKLLETARKSTELSKTTEKVDVDAVMGEGSRNDKLFRLASHYQALSYPNDAVRALTEKANAEKCQPPLDEAEVNKILGSVLGYPKGKSEEFRKNTKNTKKVQYIEDMVEAIKADEELSTVIRYNTLAYSPWICGVLPWNKDGTPENRQWNDVDDAQFQRYMEYTYGFTSADKMLKALSIAMDDNSFSPIVEHLNCLKGTWDGKPRMDTLLVDFLGAEDTELNRAIMRLFMFGAIARAYHPGCQFDYMLIFVGEQGIGKSTFLRKLAMSDVWFDGNYNSIDGTQAVERLRGMWMVEMSELLALKRAKEVEAMKSFITNRSDNYRAPYARRTTARPRQCVFAGSTNKEMFLTDPTGNRRFMPVKTNLDNVKKDLFADEKEVNEYFCQAWAEALDMYFKEKPKLVLPKKLQKRMLEAQESFTEEDPRAGIIQEYINNSQHNRHCVVSIWREALGYDGTPDRKTTNELHDILRNSIKNILPMSNKQLCREYGIQRCYERNFDEIEGFEEVSNEENIPF